MNADDKEIQLLQTKIEEQDVILKKLRNEQTKLATSIAEFKETMRKKTMADEIALSEPSTEDLAKLRKQLEKQIQNATVMLKNNQNELKALQKRSNKVKTGDLEALEQAIKEKEIFIKNMREEIKDLQFVKRKQQKVVEKKKKEDDGVKLTKLIEEVRKNREVLEAATSKFKAKEEILKRKKKMAKQLQGQYQKKCRSNGEPPLTFEDFKEKRRPKKRDDESQSKPKSKKAHTSVKQIINSQLVLGKVEYNEQTFRQLQLKKQVAESSLQNAQKKYENHVEQLNQKLSELKQENETLTTRLMQKLKEKEMGDMMDAQPYKTGLRKLTPIK